MRLTKSDPLYFRQKQTSRKTYHMRTINHLDSTVGYRPGARRQQTLRGSDSPLQIVHPAGTTPEYHHKAAPKAVHWLLQTVNIAIHNRLDVQLENLVPVLTQMRIPPTFPKPCTHPSHHSGGSPQLVHAHRVSHIIETELAPDVEAAAISYAWASADRRLEEWEVLRVAECKAEFGKNDMQRNLQVSKKV